MLYSEIASLYEKLEAEPSKLGKTAILADFLKKVPTNLLPKIVLFSQGLVFPKYLMLELGIAEQLMIRIISRVTGISPSEVENMFKKTGGLGTAAEELIKSKKQLTLVRKKLTVDFVFESLQKLPYITGKGSQERKLSLIAELLASADPKEATYIIRTILGELRIGVAEGIIRDAIVDAFLFKEGMSKEEKTKLTEAVDYAWNILSDFSEVARIAKEEDVVGLRKVKIKLGRPMQVMLGLSAESIESVVKEFGKVVAEYKYDGARVIVEKEGDKIWIYTRRQEDVTQQFPDIVEFALQGLKAKECVVEGEALGIDPKTNKPVAFQQLSQRIHRKYEIKEMIKKIPVQVNLFDILYLDGKSLLDKPLKERIKILGKVVKPIPGKFQIAKRIITDDVKTLEKFYHEALNEGQEGLMLKVMDAPYTFGRHVGAMYKIKPIMETLDLTIIGAEWGTGKRAKWITSYVLGCRDPDTGKFLSCGMMSTGLTEEQYQQMTEAIKPLTIEEKGRT
ncbi:MAG: ATP-dependent DNA ligase, partial [Candidatus Aenigmarchaeota archaeon]|nr:ATP-dependent DNA ligase [Candidatus Aenigmarchaeota archaeon]